MSLLILGAAVWRHPLVAAHAEIERSLPADGAEVGVAPSIIEVWFSEEVDPNGTTLTVLGPDGVRVDRADSAVDLYDINRQHVIVSLRSNYEIVLT